MRIARRTFVLFLLLGSLSCLVAAAQDAGYSSELPDAPEPQSGAGNATGQLPDGKAKAEAQGSKPLCDSSSKDSSQPPCATRRNMFSRFVVAGKSAPLTPEGKLYLAGRSIVDPFNLLTIAADSAIAIGSDSHSPYGPGMSGFGKYYGVAFTGDVTGEFFGTFLIPTLAHQDPRYHRMPQASIPRRVGHAIVQVVRTKADDGSDMPNYGTIFGLAAADLIANAYVPGRDTGPGITVQRWATGIGSAPIDNFITEFLPDIARHINVRVVLFQRILNSVARADTQ